MDLTELITGKTRGSQVIEDFNRWFAAQEHDEPKIIGEELPPGVPSLWPRLGIFGDKSTTGLDGSKEELLTCSDAEASPPPPCAATGECGDLLELARRHQRASQTARVLSDKAVEALNAAQVLLRRVRKGATILTMMPKLSVYSPGEPNGPGGEPWSEHDMMVRTILGPLPAQPLPRSSISPYVLTQQMEGFDFDHRTAEYLQRANDSRPLQLIEPQGRMPIHKPIKQPIELWDFEKGLPPPEKVLPLKSKLEFSSAEETLKDKMMAGKESLASTRTKAFESMTRMASGMPLAVACAVGSPAASRRIRWNRESRCQALNEFL